MFCPNDTVIEAFASHAVDTFRSEFPDDAQGRAAVLDKMVRHSLGALANCDCAYHDLHHTAYVTDAGFAVLTGRRQLREDVDAHEWLQVVVALLFHDIGFIRGALSGDGDGRYVVDDRGRTVEVPPGGTDAYLAHHHVTRSRLYTREHLADEPLIDVARVGEHIEMTRFPVPATERYSEIDTLPALVRAADLIGQMADPNYIAKLSRLHSEFVETGDAERMGFGNAAELRTEYPNFFYTQVHPYIGEALVCLRETDVGRKWISNLFHHVHAECRPEAGPGPERFAVRASATVTNLANFRRVIDR